MRIEHVQNTFQQRQELEKTAPANVLSNPRFQNKLIKAYYEPARSEDVFTKRNSNEKPAICWNVQKLPEQKAQLAIQ